MEKEGLCDVRQGDCSTVQVYGHGFKDSYELKCEFVKEKVLSASCFINTVGLLYLHPLFWHCIHVFFSCWNYRVLTDILSLPPSPSVSLISFSLSSAVSLVKFVDGEWVLDEPQFVLAIFLDVTALECQLPLEDSPAPADQDLETATNRPLARWQIKVSHVSNHFCECTVVKSIH